MKIELNKKYRYRNGKPARVLCVDAPGTFPVVTLLPDGDPVCLTRNGNYYEDGEDSGLDLIEVREPLECWLFVEDGKLDYDAYPHHSSTPQRRLFREVIE